MRRSYEKLISDLTVLLSESDSKHDSEMVEPDEYRKIIGKCPDSWNFDGKSCKQVRTGPSKFRIGSFEPEIRDKLRAAKAKDSASDSASDKSEPAKVARKTKLELPPNPIADEATVPPPKGKAYEVDPNDDPDGDGITDSARVGLCGRCTAPPKSIPRLANLTADEREVESRFADAFEKDADKLVDEYTTMLEKGQVGDAPNVFATDDAKALSPDYNPQGVSKEESNDAKGRYNVATHQTANAVAKRAFLRKLDELAKLPKDDKRRSILMTCGGVASGKGFAIGNVEEVKKTAGEVGAVWDSAGEQNGTEAPWVLEEAKKRGLKSVFVFVDSDPKETWGNPKRGVIERAKKVGRMVDARLFADSYVLGAKNFKAMQDKHKENDAAEFFVLSSRNGPPKRVPEVPSAATDKSEDQIYKESLEAIHALTDLPPAIKRGGTIGQRIWKD